MSKKIDKKLEFVRAISSGMWLSGEETISGFIDKIDDQVMLKRKSSKSVSGGLNNAHGDWYEWILAILGWNYRIENKVAYIPLMLPNVRSLDIADLYVDELKDLISDLRYKVKKASSVSLVTSNPDFILIDVGKIEDKIPQFNQKIDINDFAENTLVGLIESYKRIFGLCGFETIAGYLSVKFTLRPDRRLQIPHEGSLYKAIYKHLQTRKWILSPTGLRYYAASSEVKPTDAKALKTVATHSITTVSDKPESAVDEVFQVNSLEEANQMFSVILNKN